MAQEQAKKDSFNFVRPQEKRAVFGLEKVRSFGFTSSSSSSESDPSNTSTKISISNTAVWTSDLENAEFSQSVGDTRGSAGQRKWVCNLVFM